MRAARDPVEALTLREERTMWPRRILAPLFVLIALLGAGVFAAAAPALAAGAPPSVGWVRVANLSAGSPAVDIYLLPFGNSANSVVLRHESYGDVSGYISVSSGQYTVATRPVGAPASSPPTLSVNFMVSPGTNYTVASLGPAAGRRLEVLKDQMATSDGSTLVRVIQASLKQDRVTVSVGQDVLAQQLSFGKVTSYMTVHPGQQTVQFTAPNQKADMSVTLATGSVHTVVVLDGSSGLQVDALTDAAGSTKAPSGGAATGLGGTAPPAPAGSAQWLAALVGGVVLIGAGIIGLRRSRRTAMTTRG
jgi:hypothetical protein